MGSSAQISSGVRRCGSQEQVPKQGSSRFRRVPVCAGAGSGGRFRRVLVCAAVGSGGNFQKVPEGSGEFQCFGRFRNGLLPTLTGAAMWLILDTFWWWVCPHGQNHCGTRMRPCSQTWHKATAVGDTTKAYFFLSTWRLRQRKFWGARWAGSTDSGGPQVCAQGRAPDAPRTEGLRGSSGFWGPALILKVGANLFQDKPKMYRDVSKDEAQTFYVSRASMIYCYVRTTIKMYPFRAIWNWLRS